MKALDLSGIRFGKLLAIRRATGEDALYYTRWWCKCDCGAEKLVARSSLQKGSTTSCGCAQSESVKQRRTTHGLSRSAEYYCWKNMMNRCYKPANISYPNYGGRGIQVCQQWSKFENFLNDMGPRPEGLSLDRKNNDGDYSKENCRWATKAEQATNTRANRLITYLGDTKTLSQWEEILGLVKGTLAYRLDHWKDLDTIMTAPPHPGKTPGTTGVSP